MSINKFLMDSVVLALVAPSFSHSFNCLKRDKKTKKWKVDAFQLISLTSVYNYVNSNGLDLRLSLSTGRHCVCVCVWVVLGTSGQLLISNM